MISKTIQDALNDQIGNEFYASHLYLAMAAYFEASSLRGFAHWMRLQGQEEASHAMRLFDIINDRSGRVILGGVAAPPTEWESPLDAMQQSLEHEQKVTADFNQLYTLAVREGDVATQNQLQWFISEQVEEEKSAGEIVDQLKLAGSHGVALLMLDRELAGRGGGAATPPA